MSREQRLAKLLQGFMDAVVDSMTKGFRIPRGVDRVFLKSYETLRDFGYEPEFNTKK